MTVCLVTHNTGIAQSSPDPLLCDTRWSKFSSLLMHGRRRGKKLWETQIACSWLRWKLTPSSVPFQIWGEPLQKKTSGYVFFLYYHPHCCTRLPCHHYRGQGLLALRNQKNVNPSTETSAELTNTGLGSHPTLSTFHRESGGEKWGSESGRDMIREEKALGESGKKRGARVNKRQREAGSFFPEMFNWLLGFSSTQLACLLQENTRS